MHRSWKTMALILAISLGTLLAVASSLGAARVSAATTPVTIKSFSFTPDSVTVPVGTTVTWTNGATIAHTATSDTGAFDTGALGAGQSGSATFNTAGTFPYHCAIHSSMHGTIVVQQVGATTVPPTTGPTTSATASATTAPATSTPTVAVPVATPIPSTVIVTSELLSSPPGVTGRFTVTFPSTTPGEGKVYFGTGPGCTGLIEVGTQDQHPMTTNHRVVVMGNDLAGPEGDIGLQPGVTYWFETVNVSSAGEEITNNGGKCYGVTIPSTLTTAPLRSLTAILTGGNAEVPPSSPTGSGTGVVTFDTVLNRVCWALTTTGISRPALASHIHRGAAGTAGPIVIPFTAPGADGTATGCATADAALIASILANPAGYYVNVHTKEFPPGAIRGQLR